MPQHVLAYAIWIARNAIANIVNVFDLVIISPKIDSNSSSFFVIVLILIRYPCKIANMS